MISPLLGPVTLTHLVRKHGLEAMAKPPAVFYPLPYGMKRVGRIAEPGYVEERIAPETVAVHLWRSRFRKVFGDAVPCEWLRGQIRRHPGNSANPLPQDYAAL
jgi:hypothetical protein